MQKKRTTKKYKLSLKKNNQINQRRNKARSNFCTMYRRKNISAKLLAIDSEIFLKNCFSFFSGGKFEIFQVLINLFEFKKKMNDVKF
jgi:hypothetical protein